MKMAIRDARRYYRDLLALKDNLYPAKMSYAISRNLEKLEEEEKRAERERIKICERFARRDEEGNLIKKEDGKIYDIPDECKEDLTREYEEFLGEEIEVDIRMIGEDVIEKCDNERYTPLTAAALYLISFMIE